LFGEQRGQTDGNDMQEGEPLRSAAPAKLNAPLKSPLGPVGEIGRKENVRYFTHLVLISAHRPGLAPL
jgi:hypothetical protein